MPDVTESEVDHDFVGSGIWRTVSDRWCTLVAEAMVLNEPYRRTEEEIVRNSIIKYHKSRIGVSVRKYRSNTQIVLNRVIYFPYFRSL